ncbi:hypothetical protein COCVIDRAFT_41198 [Bipolaris victoriae FI3]|uniref:Uncharacterized protein n=1 Tax=Bipolaris victoriae (strain FI3) TaxID=930091 RepID=W7E7L7_BIPV3|nr:hypothetical protein COCVIDRAFT_41198 [Bipolaris victoriae FI3]
MPFPAAFGLPALPACLPIIHRPYRGCSRPPSPRPSSSSPHPVPAPAPAPLHIPSPSYPILDSATPIPRPNPIARLSPASPSTSPAAATGRHSTLGPHLISSSPACPPILLSRLCSLPFIFLFGLSAALLASAPVSGRPFFPGHYLAVPDARCTCYCTSLWPTSGTRRLACCLCATICRQCAAPPVPLHNICLSAAVCFVT